MPDQQTHVFNIPDFLAGVHTYALWDKRPLNSLEKAKNCVFDRAGFLKRRPGLDQVGSQTGTSWESTIPMDVLVAGYGANRQLVLVRRDTSVNGVRVNSWNGSTWSTWTGPTTVLNSNVIIQSAFARQSDNTEFVYILAGGFLLERLSVDGGVNASTSTAVRPTERAHIALNFLDRLWVTAMNTAKRDYLWYSPIGEPEAILNSSYDSNVIKIQGEYITALSKMRDNILFIGTDVSVYALVVGESNLLLDWELRQISSDVGVGSAKTVAQGNQDVYFLDSDLNVRSIASTISSLNATVNPVPLSFSIKDQIDSVGFSNMPFTSAGFFDGLYIFCVQTGSLNGNTGQAWIYDSFIGSWTGPHQFVSNGASGDIGANMLSVHTNTKNFAHTTPIFTNRQRGFFLSGLSQSHVSAAQRAKVYEWDSTIYTDDADSVTAGDGAGTSAITVEIITRPHDFGVPHQQKIVKWIEIDYGDESTAFSGTGSFDVYMKKDFAAAWTQVGSSVSYTSSTKFARTRIDTQTIGRGKVFQARIVDTSTTDGPKIRSMRFAFQAIPVGDD